MKTIITAEDLRDIYGNYCDENRITEAPEADDLTAEQLAEMVEDFEWRTESRDRFDILAVAESVISDWINDYLYNLDHN